MRRLQSYSADVAQTLAPRLAVDSERSKNPSKILLHVVYTETLRFVNDDKVGHVHKLNYATTTDKCEKYRQSLQWLICQVRVTLD